MKALKTLLLFLLSVSLFLTVSGSAFGKTQKQDNSLRMGEYRNTLDPMKFNDPFIREAYAAAKKIPWIIDSIYCYCYCKESFGHKSLLSCYVDDHASV